MRLTMKQRSKKYIGGKRIRRRRVKTNQRSKVEYLEQAKPVYTNTNVLNAEAKNRDVFTHTFALHLNLNVSNFCMEHMTLS